MSFVSLGEFHTLVSDAIGKGSSLDTVIPSRVRMAASWIERNYTFQYMKNWKVLTVDPNAEYPYILSLYGLAVKEIEGLRRRTTGSDGSIQFGRPMQRVHPLDRESRPAGQPESYWLNGVSSIIFNSVPDEEMTFEAHLVQFTSWGSGSDWTHWLLDNATNLLLVRTLMLMSARTRDPKMWQTLKAEFDLEIQAFNVAEEAIQNQSPFVAVWEPPESATLDTSLRSS